MGNVSYVVPSIHPMIKSAPAGTAIHTEAFAGFAASAEADLAVLDGAQAVSVTHLTLATTPSVYISAAAASLKHR